MWKENANKGGNNGRFDRYYAEKTIDGVRYRFRSTSKHNVERWESIIKLIFSHYTLPLNNIIIDRINSVLNMFDTPDNECDNKVSFHTKKDENILCVAFSTTRMSIQRIIDRSIKINFEGNE